MSSKNHYLSALVLLFCVSCLSQKNEKSTSFFKYKVSKGDTLFSIAQKTNVPWPQIIQWNQLSSPSNQLEVGRILNIGFTQEEAEEHEDEPVLQFRQGNQKGIWFNDGVNIMWPTHGKVTSEFGYRRGKLHAGIDISATPGSSIIAVDDGYVEYVGFRKGYGRMILMSHQKGYKTLYAHLKRTKVKNGEWIGQGQVIGHMGASGNARGVHLHFEYRSADNVPIDPRHLLPRMDLAQR